jgi:beta-glucosidase
VRQLPLFYNSHPSRGHKYVDDDGKPLFPFGFGLSYTTFRYDKLEVHAPVPGSHAHVQGSVNVTNTGEKEGDEVAQLYVRQDVSSVSTPSRSLKAFSRIHLKPGETKAVTFQVPQIQLALWNAHGKWVVEPGQYTFWVGGSSEASLAAQLLLQP